jgi:hypothetical protein
MVEVPETESIKTKRIMKTEGKKAFQIKETATDKQKLNIQEEDQVAVFLIGDSESRVVVLKVTNVKSRDGNTKDYRGIFLEDLNSENEFGFDEGEELDFTSKDVVFAW